MNERGRIVCCGAVSQYDTSQPSGSPRGTLAIGKQKDSYGRVPSVRLPKGI